MIQSVRRFLCWCMTWRRFCALLTLLFLCRGVFVLTVLPPFEGWDEYQHLAYIAYLDETGHSPQLGDTCEVPRSLYDDLVRFPHGVPALGQIGKIGAVSHEDFWDAAVPPRVREDAPGIVLYQAQHAGLYYRFALPIYRALGGGGDALAALTVLRIINVLFGTVALVVALYTIGRLMREGSTRYVLGLLIALQPLFLLNCARVANDALAVMLGTITISILLVLMPRRFWLGVIAGGIVLGLGILAKTLILSLVPFALFVFFVMAMYGRLRMRRAMLGGLVLIGLAAAITFPYFYFNMTHYGMLTPLQEAVQNQASGKTLSDMFLAMADVDWWRRCGSRYFHYSLWFGGWSWLKPPALLKHIHGISLCIGIVGLLSVVRRRPDRRQWLFREPTAIWSMIVLGGSVAAALAYHAVQTKMASGSVMTNSWYAAIAFPWMLCLYCQGLALFSRRWILNALAGLMVLTYFAMEVYGTLWMLVPEYTGQGWGRLAKERLAMLHHPGFGPGWTMPALSAMSLLVVVSVGVWLVSVRSERSTQQEGT